MRHEKHPSQEDMLAHPAPRFARADASSTMNCVDGIRRPKMNSHVKQTLLRRLTESHESLRATLEGVDLETVVYADSGWRIRDIIGHIATWDREIAKALRAFLAGEVYLTPDIGDDESAFNEQAVAAQRQLSTQQILSEWEGARAEFKAAIEAIPPERFPGDMLYPWGDERGDIAGLVETMIKHDAEHRADILHAIRSS
ncbi:MAG: hypothetical protein D6770_08120 [Anaerolineae bacterium]|nr:MAG: hypothetical protein D6770_08120 [Anaerolineae bacterium]